MSYSLADARAQVPPPDTCQHCTSMQVWRCPGNVTRWRCGQGLHLQDPCKGFDALPDSRKAIPANAWATPSPTE